MSEYTAVLLLLPEFVDKRLSFPSSITVVVEADDMKRAAMAGTFKAVRDLARIGRLEPSDFHPIAVFAGRHHNLLQPEE